MLNAPVHQAAFGELRTFLRDNECAANFEAGIGNCFVGERPRLEFGGGDLVA